MNNNSDEDVFQVQYITDEVGNKTAIILSMNQFEEISDKMANLAKQIDELKKAAKSDSQEIETLKAAATEPAQNLESSQILFLKQQYEWLKKVLDGLRQSEQMQAEAERKLQILQVIKTVDSKYQEIGRELGEVKKQSKSVGLYRVPTLPSHFVENVSIFNEIKPILTADVTGEKRPPIVLQASTAMGKSVMAAALARDTEVQEAFPDGIFWLRLGADADLVAHQIALIHALDENAITDFIDLETGAKRLRELCATRLSLLILDDVWDAQQILAFDVVGEYCQILITSSENDMLNIVQCVMMDTTKAYEIQPLSEQQAIDFFTACLEHEKKTSASKKTDEKKERNLSIFPKKHGKIVNVFKRAQYITIVRACEYSPMALKLMANVASTQPQSEWDELLKRFQEDEYELPENYPRSLMQIFFFNMEALGEPADYYFALSVFADYTSIPQFVVLMLWRYLYQLRDEEAIEFINELADKGLLQIEERDSERYLILHAFQRDYLQAESEPEKLHGHLLAAYRLQCGQHGWLGGPNDGYFFENICMHLHYAERDNELKSLLLDFDWIQTKLQATSVSALLSDYEWLENKEVEAVKKALSDGTVPLLKNKETLPIQLLDGLWGKESLRENKDIQALLNQAQELAPEWRWEPEFPEWKEGEVLG